MILWYFSFFRWNVFTLWFSLKLFLLRKEIATYRNRFQNSRQRFNAFQLGKLFTRWHREVRMGRCSRFFYIFFSFCVTGFQRFKDFQIINNHVHWVRSSRHIDSICSWHSSVCQSIIKNCLITRADVLEYIALMQIILYSRKQ